MNEKENPETQALETEPFDPFASKAPVIVYVDIKSPYAFIAKDPTRALERELGVKFDWRPLTLNIPSYLGSAQLDKKGNVAKANRTPQQWSGVKYAYRDARRYAKMQGYVLRGTEKIWDTALIHMGMQWSKREGHDATARYLDCVYEPFWRRALDVEDIATVTAMLEAAEVPTTGFADYAQGAGRTYHDQTQLQIFEAGIFGVPAYVVDAQWFFGREHLPTIGWLASGKQGPPPDIAYDRMIDPDPPELPAAQPAAEQ